MFEEEGALIMTTSADKVQELNDNIMELHKNLYPTDKKEGGQEGQGPERSRSRQSTEAEGQWVTHWETEPKYSSTEICISGLDEEVSVEEITSILGGGNIIRDVRRARDHTYVAFWTVHNAMEGLDFAQKKLERAGHKSGYVVRALWRRDLHIHELNEGQDAQATVPHYTAFDNVATWQDWGVSTRRRITQNATSEGAASSFTASVEMKPQKKRTRKSPKARGEMSDSS